MLNQSTTDKLYAMRLRGMAEGFRAQQEQTNLQQLTFFGTWQKCPILARLK